jgi:hypothetical protein
MEFASEDPSLSRNAACYFCRMSIMYSSTAFLLFSELIVPPSSARTLLLNFFGWGHTWTLDAVYGI